MIGGREKLFRLTYRDRYSNENSKSEFFNDIKDLGQALISIVNNEKEENSAMEWCGRAAWGDKVVRNKFGYKIECFNETELKNNVENVVKEICNKLHCNYTYIGWDNDALTFDLDTAISWIKFNANCEYYFVLNEDNYPNGIKELISVVDKDKDKFIKQVLESYDRVTRQMLSDIGKEDVTYCRFAVGHTYMGVSKRTGNKMAVLITKKTHQSVFYETDTGITGRTAVKYSGGHEAIIIKKVDDLIVISTDKWS